VSFIQLALQKRNETLKAFDLVFELRGVSNVFSSSVLVDVIRIGDELLFIDGTWLIGGSREIANQSSDPLLSLSESTTTIQSSVAPDEAKGTSVEFMKVGLIDKDGEVSRLISPGVEYDEMLGRDVKIWIGFQSTFFKGDYLPVFRGIVSGVTASSGIVYFNLSSSEEKKRADLFLDYESELTSEVTDSDTTIPVVSTAEFLSPITGPDGLVDSSFVSYLKIEDEFMKVLGVTETSFTVERGSLSSSAATHDLGKEVTFTYVLQGNPIELALKLMLSRNDYYFELQGFRIGISLEGEVNDRVISFPKRQLILEENIQAGDFITITDSVSNDVVLKRIESITESTSGTILLVEGVSFSVEETEIGVIKFRSKYDTFPTKLALLNDDVDISIHESFISNFFPSTIFKFYISEAKEGKVFLDDELYKPCAVYSLSKDGRAGLGYHFPPLPNVNIQILNEDVIKEAGSLSIERSINKNFYNNIVYKYEDSLLDSDFKRSVINLDATSVARIPVGSRSLVIESRGMRDEFAAESFANSQSLRRLNRYKFAAEEIASMGVFISNAFLVSLGEAVLLDGKNLNLLNSSNGTRKFEPRLMEVTEKRINIITGSSELTLLDTGFGLENTFFLMSPFSRVRGSFGRTIFLAGTSEWVKWKKYEAYGFKIRLRFDMVYGATEIKQNLVIPGVFPFIGTQVSVGEDNTLTVAEDLPGTVEAVLGVSEGLIMELAPYEYQTEPNIEAVLKVFGFMNDTDFADRNQYQMI
jgi:hypothetical protein